MADRRRVSNYVQPADTVPFSAVIGDVVGRRFPVAVVSGEGFLLGALAASAARLPADTPVARVLDPAPGTIRGEMRIDDVVRQLKRDGLDHVFVTAVNGALFGVIRLGELHV